MVLMLRFVFPVCARLTLCPWVMWVEERSICQQKCDHLHAIPPHFPSSASFNLSASQRNVCPQGCGWRLCHLFDVPLSCKVGPVCTGTSQEVSKGGTGCPSGVPRCSCAVVLIAPVRCTLRVSHSTPEGRWSVRRSTPSLCTAGLLNWVTELKSEHWKVPQAASPAESVVEAQTCSDLLQHSCPAALAEARGLGFVLINVRLPLPHLLSLVSPTLFCPAGYEPSSVPGLWAPPGGVAEPWGGHPARRLGFGGLCMKLVQWVWDAQAPFILEVNASSEVLRRWGGVKIFIGKVWAKSSWKDSFDCLLLRFGHFELKGTPTWTLEKLRGWGALDYITLAASLQLNWPPGLKFSFFRWFKTKKKGF